MLFVRLINQYSNLFPGGEVENDQMNPYVSLQDDLID